MSAHSGQTKRLPGVSPMEAGRLESALRRRESVQQSMRLNTGARLECPIRAVFARRIPSRLDRRRRTVQVMHDLGASQHHSFRRIELGKQKISPNDRDD